MPLSTGTLCKNCSMASRPPAEAPIPIIGKASAVHEVSVLIFLLTGWAELASLDFFIVRRVFIHSEGTIIDNALPERETQQS